VSQDPAAGTCTDNENADEKQSYKDRREDRKSDNNVAGKKATWKNRRKK
jgi:hypothetical protein